MVGYETEEQQWEAIKKWFSKHGNMLSWIVIIVMSIFLGGRYWLHHKEVLVGQASEHYFGMLKSEEQNDEASVQSKANRLINEYAKTPYAQIASLMLAKKAVEGKDYVQAEKHLKWVMEKSIDNDFKKIARIRLIKVFLAAGELDKAYALYDKKNANGWLTLMEELKGDMNKQENKLADAVDSYKAAILAAPDEALHGPLLTLKLNNLGLSNKDIEALKESEATKQKG
ncbi:tetratricopeptide repeat protein [Candidatus Berkiella cookevillensis]|uniref:Tetratricopeptide repeat protein n=1 Tax=Candidatus Berkiella cookevillensis TaxID=437022 RepID=A0A0Q9YCE5_9GAMM|nr:tetratricopeptide repeat protein [Candidatus Berkiella cookevillensis]MCS5708711.1 tetratricopeptide repeat protein [Candidatus Berkiella cookevillensis]